MTYGSFAPPGFILGSGRSGTTLLATILNRHSRICVTPETHFFQHVSLYPGGLSSFASDWPESIRKIAQKMPPTNSWDPVSSCEIIVQKLGSRPVTATEAFRALGELIASDVRKPLWIEKTPMHNYFIPEIRSCFPSAPIIHIVRDGRDVANSMVTANWCSSYFENLTRWVAELRATELALRNDPYSYSLRYEDLVSDPEGSISRLCEFLRVGFEPAMLTPDGSEQNLIEAGMSHKEQVREPISASKVSAWRTKLSDEQKATSTLLAGSELQRWNYPEAQSAPPSALPLWLGRKFDSTAQEHAYDRVIDALGLINKPISLAEIVAPYGKPPSSPPALWIIAGLGLGTAYTPSSLSAYASTVIRTLKNCIRSRRSGTTLVYLYHGDPKKTRAWRFRALLERWIVRSASIIVCPCSNPTDCAARKVFHLPKSSILHANDPDFKNQAAEVLNQNLGTSGTTQR